VGPSGTGKTLLAKAARRRSRRSFFSLSGSDFVDALVESWGLARVRDLSRKAVRKAAPAIIFIDELDPRGAVNARRLHRARANDEREQTLTRSVVEMDGIPQA